MTDIDISSCDGRVGGGKADAATNPFWLSISQRILAGMSVGIRYLAAPVFLTLAVIGMFDGDHVMQSFCSGGGIVGWLTGMPAMYGLMGVVHLPPWFGLLARR